jgi:large subunit ribosomal protein L22
MDGHLRMYLFQNSWSDTGWVNFHPLGHSEDTDRLQSEQWIKHNTMEYQATSKYIRTTTRKLRLIADLIREMSPSEALIQLDHMPKLGAEPMGKALASAIANASQKKAAGESLRFKTIEVMGGPVMKRFHAVSRGQAHSYKKRMTHVRIILTDEGEKKE